ncbi:MAG: hypothetical protein SNJ58_11015 [Aggregatilineales bacterium]
MPISVEPYVAERILFERYVAPVNPETDMVAAIQAIKEFHQQVQREFFVIVDAREFPVTFDVLVEALDLVRRQMMGVPARFVVIGDSELIRLAAEAIAQRQYGGFEAGKVFATDTDAFEYCTAELRKSA